MKSFQTGRCKSTEVTINGAKARIDTTVKRIADRKRVLEESRSTTVRQFGDDLEQIARSELQFAKSIIEEIVPIKITIQQENFGRFWEELTTNLPIRIDFKEGTDILHHGMHTIDPKHSDVEPAVSAVAAESDGVAGDGGGTTPESPMA